MRKSLRLFASVLMGGCAFAGRSALAQTALEQDMRYQDMATMTMGETLISLGGGFAYLTLPDTRFNPPQEQRQLQHRQAEERRLR